MGSSTLFRGLLGVVNIADVVGVSLDSFGRHEMPYYLNVHLRCGGSVVLEKFSLLVVAESALDTFESVWSCYLAELK